MKHASLAFLLALSVIATVMLSGCNTVEGAGKDIQNAGQGIQNAADKHKDDDD